MREPFLKFQLSELGISKFLQHRAFALKMPLEELTRATPSWDHLSTAPSGVPLGARLTQSSCCLETTRGLWGIAPRGPGSCLSFINVPRSQTPSPGRWTLLIRWVCSHVYWVGDIIPAWSYSKNTVFLWSFPVSITDRVPEIRQNLGPVHSENHVTKRVCEIEISFPCLYPISSQWE